MENTLIDLYNDIAQRENSAKILLNVGAGHPEAARMIAEDKLMDTAYQSLAGPVTPFDIVYSHRQFTGRDKPFMAHHCGFTLFENNVTGIPM